MKSIQYLVPSILILSSLLINCFTLHADWDPMLCSQDNNINVLNDPAFKELKTKVRESLANTWCSSEKVDLLMDLTYIIKPAVCVEVGAFTGSSVLPVATTLKLLKHGKVFAIDAWSNIEAIKYLDLDDPNRAWWAQVDMKDVKNTFDTMIKKWSLDNYCSPICKSSEIAVVEVNNIDFLHLDGDYSEFGALRDVQLFLPKVKSGGYILLSNVFVMIKNRAPKMRAFSLLFDACDIVCEIERDNVILFRKK